MLKLPLIFRPEKESNFVRLGRNNDGGYIVPVDAAKDSNLLLSFGLDDDWSFEKDFYEINIIKLLFVMLVLILTIG